MTEIELLKPFTRWAIFDGGRVHRLSDLIPQDFGWRIASAADINHRGQVIGIGVTPYHDVHGFLLDPVPAPTGVLWIVAGTLLTGLVQQAGVPGGIRRMRDRMGPRSMAGGDLGAGVDDVCHGPVRHL
jgi:hypothetical protein